jgi:hypothetical protein
MPIAMDLPPGDISANSIHTFEWTIPESLSNQCVVRVRQDNSGTDYEDVSDANFSIAGTLSVSADSFAINTGRLDSGGLTNLFDSDDQYLVMDATFTLFHFQLVCTVDATSPTDTPTELEFNCESKTFNMLGTVSQTIELFNFDTGQFETVDMGSTTPIDSVIAVTPSGDPTRFVETGTGAMRARIRYQSSLEFWVFVLSRQFLPFETSVDHISWNVRP